MLGVVNTLTRMNPFIAIATALITLAPLIYNNWGAITDFIKSSFDAAITWITDKFTAFINFFKNGLESLKSLAPSLGGFFDDAEKTQAHGMRPPGAESPTGGKNIVQAGSPQVKGAIEVNFNNAPQGMRVEPTKSGNVAVKPNVGYRSFATAGAQ